MNYPDDNELKHFISKTCIGESCSICGNPASHKVGEEVPHEEPNPFRHNYTAYVCCAHFRMIFGPAVLCPSDNGAKS